LTGIGRELGLVDDARFAAFERKREAIERENARLGALWAAPNNALGREVTGTLGLPLSRETNVLDLLRRPEVDYARLLSLPSLAPGGRGRWPGARRTEPPAVWYVGGARGGRAAVEAARRPSGLPWPA